MLTKIEVPSWQYDEFKHPGEDFDFEAKYYDERFKHLSGVLVGVKRMVELLNLQPDHTVLDIGAVLET